METLFNEFQLNFYYDWSNNWVFVVSLVVLALEGLRFGLKKLLSWNMLGDTVTNFITFYGFLGITYLLVATFYTSGYYLVYEYFSITQIPTNGWTILACLLLADIGYYWEHRMSHRVGIGWATHTVHHSSPYFNMSVAYRFGPLDGVFSFFFYLPLAVMGFNPILIFLCESTVLLYQTFLHTEMVRKFPKPVEAILNTPSHHRVHHGANRQYWDKNYAGIFIIWDRMFGTFAEEKEKVVYGISEPLNSINPLVVFFHGLQRLGKQIISARGIKKQTKLPHQTARLAAHQQNRAPVTKG